MPIHLEWDPSTNNLLRVTVGSGWTIEDLATLEDQIVPVLDEAIAPVNFLMNWQADTAPPRIIGRFNRIAASPIITHFMSGLVMIIGLNTYLVKLYGMITKIHPALLEKILVLEDADEAYDLLETLSLFKQR